MHGVACDCPGAAPKGGCYSEGRLPRVPESSELPTNRRWSSPGNRDRHASAQSVNNTAGVSAGAKLNVAKKRNGEGLPVHGMATPPADFARADVAQGPPEIVADQHLHVDGGPPPVQRGRSSCSTLTPTRMLPCIWQVKTGESEINGLNSRRNRRKFVVKFRSISPKCVSWRRPAHSRRIGTASSVSVPSPNVVRRSGSLSVRQGIVVFSGRLCLCTMWPVATPSEAKNNSEPTDEAQGVRGWLLLPCGQNPMLNAS